MGHDSNVNLPYRFDGRVGAVLRTAPVFLPVLKTNFYIDGFNLSYRAVRGTEFQWLDLRCLCQTLAPAHEVNRIRYFTAQLLSRGNSGNQTDRLNQSAYLRAITTIPNLTIHYGQFRERRISRPLVSAIPGQPRFVEVWDTEEKGTDVNLASFLLLDGFDQEYEQAVVISNDADLALPIRMVRDNLRFPVGIVNPNQDPRAYTPKELTDAATFVRRLRSGTLRNCQFPPELQDATGVITKPAGW